MSEDEIIGINIELNCFVPTKNVLNAIILQMKLL